MNKKMLLLIISLLSIFLYTYERSATQETPWQTSGAGQSLDAWSMERTFPEKKKYLRINFI